MANDTTFFGLQVENEPSGVPLEHVSCRVLSSYGTVIALGDPVVLVAGGSIDPNSGKELPNVNRATAGDSDPIYGVVTGIYSDSFDHTKEHLPASTGGTVKVCVDNRAIYRIRYNGTTANTDEGGHCNINTGTAASVVTGKSGVCADTITHSDASGVKQLTIVGVVNEAGTSIGLNGIYRVKLNQPQIRPLGVAV